LIGVSVNGSIEIAPLLLDMNVGLGHELLAVDFAFSLGSQLLGEEGSKTLLPIPHCFGKNSKPLSKKNIGMAG
jgi:hypothetical protein